MVGIVLNPQWLYASKTSYKNFNVFHDKPIDSHLQMHLDEAITLLTASEFYNPTLKLDICLNDGSNYPTLMRKLRGPAFAWGFYDKVVLQGDANYKGNYSELHGYKWNLTQLLVHEAIHCLQFDKLGLWKSNPIGKIPDWKQEGYPEYVSRKNTDQTNLSKNIERLIEAEKTDKDGWGISFADSTIAPREYYNYWILVQYCMDIKKMTYAQILKDATAEEKIQQEMMSWYELNN